MTTQVRNRGKGKSSDPFDEHNPEHVYIGRRDPWGRWEASKWANPFTKKHAATRGQAATLYREWLAGRDDFSDLPSVKEATPERRAALLAALPERCSAGANPTPVTAMCSRSWPKGTRGRTGTRASQ